MCGWRKNKIRTDGSTRVLADVTNTGKREGAEVVQMYIRDVVSSVTRPVKELKGFQKVTLRPGETKTVAFRHHAGIARVLRREHEIRRRTGRFRHHDRQFVARRGPDESSRSTVTK